MTPGETGTVTGVSGCPDWALRLSLHQISALPGYGKQAA
jgi:hypothetical protein